MTMARGYTGRYAMIARYCVLLCLIACSRVFAAESVPVTEAVYDLDLFDQAESENLDTAIFTEISAITSDDIAIRLPDDQKEK